MVAFGIALVVCMVMLGAAIATYLQGGPGNELVAVGGAGLGFVLFAPYLIDWYFLTVCDDKIVLSALWRTREIPYADMANIDIETRITEGHGARCVQMYLRIKGVSGRTLRLKSFGHQTLRIRRLMEQAPGFGIIGSGGTIRRT
jgi:hypothetical protein